MLSSWPNYHCITLLEGRSTGKFVAIHAPPYTDSGQSIYINGRWFSQNVVSTMLVVWLICVALFVGFLLWQHYKYRNKTGDKRRASSHKRSSRKTRHHRRNNQ